MLNSVGQFPLTVILIGTTAAYLLLLVPYWQFGYDSAIYISLAQSLASGEGYVYMGFPHTKYPPGLPLLLAPIEFLFGHNYLLMRLWMTVCAVGSIGLTWFLIRPMSSSRVALAVCVMTASSYAFVHEVPGILSDVPLYAGLIGCFSRCGTVHARPLHTSTCVGSGSDTRGHIVPLDWRDTCDGDVHRYFIAFR